MLILLWLVVSFFIRVIFIQKWLSFYHISNITYFKFLLYLIHHLYFWNEDKDELTVFISLRYKLLSSDIHKICFFAFLFLGDGLDHCLLYNVTNSVHSSSGTVSIRSNPLNLPICLDSWVQHSRVLFNIAFYIIRLYFHHQSHPQLDVVFALAPSLHSGVIIREM